MTLQNCMKKKTHANVVFILTDDQGWGDLSLNGNTNLSTPHIDRLAHSGAVFNHFYVQPVCAPTRAEILTGRYFPRTGVRGVTQRAEYMNIDETTIGDVFKAAGYTTGCFGKWHSGSAYPYHPNGRGFDEFFGYCCGHWSHYFDSTLEHNGEEIKTQGYLTDVLTDEAMAFMELNQHRPFFCYVPLNTPHSPFQVPDRWYDPFKDKELLMRYLEHEKENLEVTRSALAMCENIDWNVGRLVEKVEELGLMDDTIFVYLSDNGPNSWRFNGNMRGKKGSTDEGGVRSPCMMTWSGMIERGLRIDEIAGAIDFLPTLADLAGIPMSSTKPLDGISLKPLLVKEDTLWPERGIFSHYAGATSLRTRKYRSGGDAGGLYDMHQDIGQQQDLSLQLPEVYERHESMIVHWQEEVLPKQTSKRYIPVGYHEFPQTYLNAQDGIPTGSITWSSIHPNASYFIHWCDTKDSMEWEIEVNASGEYDVTLMYACFQGDEGVQIKVSFNDNSIMASITEPFDTPEKRDSDRVKREESYEKEFTALQLGRITLDNGKGRLRLSAANKAGEEICQVRALRLSLVGSNDSADI